MQEGSHPVRPRGRPSSSLINSALIDAAIEELIDNGYQAMTMESIATRADVSKVSLYRRWNSKLAIVTEVLQTLSKVEPVTDHGSFEADIRNLIEQTTKSRSAKAKARIVMRMIGEISTNAELLPLYRKYLLVPRLGQLRQLVDRAHARKELRADLPVDIACVMISGPLFVYYLALLAETRLDMSPNITEQLTRAILASVAK